MTRDDQIFRIKQLVALLVPEMLPELELESLAQHRMDSLLEELGRIHGESVRPGCGMV